jgi:hypothetical protein
MHMWHHDIIMRRVIAPMQLLRACLFCHAALSYSTRMHLGSGRHLPWGWLMIGKMDACTVTSERAGFGEGGKQLRG